MGGTDAAPARSETSPAARNQARTASSVQTFEASVGDWRESNELSAISFWLSASSRQTCVSGVFAEPWQRPSRRIF